MNPTITNRQNHRPAAAGLPAAHSPWAGGIPSLLDQLEETAFDLATEAGDLIVQSLEQPITVSYKDTVHGIMAPRDPVSNVDRAVEEILRRRLAARHPGHAFLGEETGRSGPADADFLWVVDPIDGTMNYVNGVPLYASAIAVLKQGVPVAGATWCASTHALRPGVYHAHIDAGLRFDGAPLDAAATRTAEGRCRTVSTVPMASPRRTRDWDHRHLGSSALEAASAAAGVLSSAHLARPWAWDVASGIVLAQASGREVWTLSGDRWQPFRTFGSDVGTWRQPVVLGSREAITALRPGLLACAPQTGISASRSRDC